MTRRVRQIAVLCPGSWEPYRQFMIGVADFVSTRKDCVLDISPDASQLSLNNLRGWPGDGVIAPIQTRGEVLTARALGIPVVNVSSAMRHSELPRVIFDNAAIGQMAADHLWMCGFRSFAYYGLKKLWFSEERRRGFVSQIEKYGGKVSVLECEPGYNTLDTWDHWAQPLEQWIKTLDLPVGVMAVHDLRAGLVLGVCLRLGLRVPDDVAIIGVDNEEITCELSSIPLSSIARNERLAGHKAAALLYRMMTKGWRGKKYPDIIVPPDRVVKRRSTDLVTIDNPRMAETVQYIRNHLDEVLGVKQLARKMNVSRRWLEQHFRETFRCTPLEYLARERVARAKALLADPEGPQIAQIAHQCGFSGSRQLAAVFNRLVGVAPLQYRRHATPSGDHTSAFHQPQKVESP